MLPFIHGVAETYIDNERDLLPQCCFVFPNKRSATFFHHAYARACNEKGLQLIHPATVTISDFILEMAHTVEPDRMEKIFLLYDAYCEIIRENVRRDIKPEKLKSLLDFNHFLRWADMILGDFNDVDMYCVDPESIFPNVKRYKEISTNYVSADVMAEIQKHWKTSAGRYSTLDDRFWNHIGQGDGDAAQTADFFRMWQILLPLYRRFNEKLDSKGMSYNGKAYLRAIGYIDSTAAEDLPYRRYVFMGFNMVSDAEEKVFALLRDKQAPVPLADFYFDDASPVFNSRFIPGHGAAIAIKSLKKKFPSLYQGAVRPIGEFPKIEIIGIPSRVGQMKIAGEIVRSLYPRQLCEDALADASVAEDLKEQLRRTAIVLPQESMVKGVMSALPGWLPAVNFTMGYRLRDSSVASLVRDIVSMHHRSHISKAGVRTFFCEDVRKVLSHPLMLQYFQNESQAIDRMLSIKHLFNVRPSDIVDLYPDLEPVFTFVGVNASPEDVIAYFYKLTRWLGRYVDADIEKHRGDVITDIDGSRHEATARVSAAAVVDYLLVHQYENSLGRLRQLIDMYGHKGFSLTESTFYQMMERLVGSEVVPLEGHPLEGLQVMGVLEARNLDFENMIIPSMNERVFPRKHYQKSLIPPALRFAYGMSTQEHQESIYSYYFFRMISRSRRVFLLYDTRNDALGRGQMSRYLIQLLHLFSPEGISFRNIGYTIEVRQPYTLEISKGVDDTVMRQVERYRVKPDDSHAGADGAARYLSASSINEFINCPLMFFLKNIAGFSREDEILDYLDEGTYGTIVHEIIEKLYDRFRSSEGEYAAGEVVSREMLTNLKKSLDTPAATEPNDIERLIIQSINRHYNRFTDATIKGCLDTPLTGDAEIFFHVIRDVVRRFLEKDCKAGPFRYVSGEHKHSTGDSQFCLKSHDELIDDLRFNLTYTIDRIDCPVGDDSAAATPQIRIIDYKTGSDPVEASRLEHLFVGKGATQERAKAILQLLLYCQAYAGELDEHGAKVGKPGMGNVAISPWIYSLRKMSKNDFAPVRIGRPDEESGRYKLTPVNDYREFVEEFNTMLFEQLLSLFDESLPFVQASSDGPCKYCKFTQICRRNTTN